MSDFTAIHGVDQIQSNTITTASIDLAAGITDGQLANGAHYIHDDGSVAFAADQSHGGHKITSLGTPTSGTDAATKAYVDSAVAAETDAFPYSNFVFNEVPAGSVNGANKVFTLANTPHAGTVTFFKGGLLLAPTSDYTISGATVTLVGAAPKSGTALLANYLK